MKKSVYYLVYLACLFFFACSNESSDDLKLQYDQTAFLTNIGQNVIIPRYEKLQKNISNLETKATDFTKNPATTELQALKTTFLTTYEQFQYCVVFDFGPAEGSKNLNSFNIYPVNSTTIESNISSGAYDFSSANQIDTKGFPAIDYLLYHTDESTILTEFETENRKTYLKKLIADIKKQVDEITNAWKTSYKSTFINNQGNASGSSLALLVNQFNYNFEDAKNFKIGIPSGSRSSLGTTYPEKVEAYYSGYSLTLAQKNLQSLKELYLGISPNNVNGIGFDDYLIGLEKQELDTRIQTKLGQIETALKELETEQNGILSDIAKNNNTILINTYNVFSTTVPLIKSEMPSLLGVAITYQDGDGD